MVSAITESDFILTLTTKEHMKVPVIISDRDTSAGIFYLTMNFTDPLSISSGKDIDSIELKTTRELTVSTGLRRVLTV